MVSNLTDCTTREGIKEVEIGDKCPLCGGQFSISYAKPGFRPKEWQSDTLGVSDCRGCQQTFLVRLSPGLRAAVLNLIEDIRIKMLDATAKDLSYEIDKYFLRFKK